VRGAKVIGRTGIGLLALAAALADRREPGATFVGTVISLGSGAVLGTLTLDLLIRPPSAAPGGATLTRALQAAPSSLAAALRRIPPKPARAIAVLPADTAPPGATRFTTPLATFYRVDTAFEPPLVDPGAWTMTVSGDLARPQRYLYADLLAMPQSEVDITIGCISNEIGGDLIGNARWHGVLLSDLLGRAGAPTEPAVVTGTSVDGFAASFPLSAALDRPALLALGMNGQTLPILHGFPARLVVPGLYGYTSATKWLIDIAVTRGTDLSGFWADRV